MNLDLPTIASEKDEAFVNIVYQLIDNRIQHIEFKTKDLIESSIQSNTIGVPFSNVNTSNIESNKQDWGFREIEQYSKKLRTLLYLRRKLNEHTVMQIFRLLDKNKFQDLPEEELKALFELKQKKEDPLNNLQYTY